MKLVIIFGPPAVGKMTVGQELEKLSGLKLFHNHMSLELVNKFFDFGTPELGRLDKKVRFAIFEEVAGSDLEGLIFTVVLAFNYKEDMDYLNEIVAIFEAQGAEICLVELKAGLQERLDLWNCAFPTTIALKGMEGLEQYLAKLDDHHHILLLDEKEIVKGWFFDFVRDAERWFIIMVSPELQGGGWGSQLVKRAQSRNDELNGWVVETHGYQTRAGQPYPPPVEFYKKLGFEIHPEVRLELPQINSIKISWRKHIKTSQK